MKNKMGAAEKLRILSEKYRGICGHYHTMRELFFRRIETVKKYAENFEWLTSEENINNDRIAANYPTTLYYSDLNLITPFNDRIRDRTPEDPVFDDPVYQKIKEVGYTWKGLDVWQRGRVGQRSVEYRFKMKSRTLKEEEYAYIRFTPVDEIVNEWKEINNDGI